MANPVKGEAVLRIEDGREFILVADMEALIEAEGVYGKPMETMMEEAAKGFVGASSRMLWGAMRCHHPEITPREVSTIFASDGKAAAAALERAIELGFPERSEKKAGNGKAGRRGKASGGNGAKQD